MEQRWRTKFGILIGALVCLAIGLAVVFVRVLEASQAAEAWNRDFETFHSSQAETELWRLIEAVDRYAKGDATVDAAALKERFDVVYGRIGTFDGGLARERLEQIPGAAAAMAAARRTVADVEPQLATVRP